MSVPTAKRHVRLLRIVQELQSGGGLNADQLADQLHVTRRTVFRDLQMIKQAGVRVCFDERLRCYRLLSQPESVRPGPFSLEELTILAAAIHFSKLRHVADCNALLLQSIRKLLAESPKHVQHSVGRLMRSCGLGDREEYLLTHGSPIVRHVLSAIALRRKLSIKVTGDHPGSTIETRLAPYQMIASNDAWQVVGLSSRHRSVCTFDARQLTEPSLTNQVYAIPRGYQGLP